VAAWGGRVPATVAELESLPGVGPYTARAVAAAAFGVPVAPLDVNVRRVVARVLGIPLASPGLQAAADELVSRGQPGRWLNAVMDLASGTCTARTPRCDACPIATMCASRGIAALAVEPKEKAVPFALTTRWLRGRLVAAVTEVPMGTWVPLPERLGQHDTDAIAVAARGLEREGFLDLRAGRARVRQ
jgi:A/G-specific adenine glycosylase